MEARSKGSLRPWDQAQVLRWKMKVRKWSTFKKCIGQLNCQLTSKEIDECQSSAKAMIDMYCAVYLAKDITPYMHVLAYHVPEVRLLYGNLTYFCQQGLKKFNDLVTKWYFCVPNFGKSALKQIMVKHISASMVSKN